MPYFCGRLKTSVGYPLLMKLSKPMHDSKTNFVEEMATMTRGVRVDFSLMIINTNYRLPGADN